MTIKKISKTQPENFKFNELNLKKANLEINKYPKRKQASAVLAASIFHYRKHSVKEVKEYLDSKGIPVRI